MKRFITWLYMRYVVRPEICAGMAALKEDAFEVVIVPDVVFQAQLQSKYNTKH